MQGKIVGENEDGIGVDVVDNNDITHQITIGKDDWDIIYHEQDGYPDHPAKRTDAGNEHVSQARRHAKWHVYRERGYDTVPSTENPDRILAALSALTELSEAEFIEQFSDLSAQVRSHFDGSTVDLPFKGVDPSEILVYQKDIYVQPDPTEFDPPVLDQFLSRLSGESDSAVAASKDEISLASQQALDFEIEAVSDLHYVHNDGQGTEQVDRPEPPLDREPDARVELMPVDPAEFESFQHYVVSHLAYQIRDCCLRMGEKPPVAFRSTGWGQYRAFIDQKLCPLYENYWDATAQIDSWSPEDR